MEFVLIQPGRFTMGCSLGDSTCAPNERPAHEVQISKNFQMCKYEVTQGQWKAVMRGNNPSHFQGNDLPVETVSWNDVQQFLERLNALNDGYRYGLPTEAEWEYAARGRTTEARYGEIDSIAWYGDNAGKARLDTYLIFRTDIAHIWTRQDDNGNQTHPVGLKQPNSFGLYDVLGNVAEWCKDWYDKAYYQNSPSVDPPGAESGTERILRGGSWQDFAQGRLRVSSRVVAEPGVRLRDIGFRCVREIKK
jgi:formylglycine-generating enzyme required for sulfatase activity